MAQIAITDTEILEAALVGLERRRSDIDEKMAALRRQIGARPARRDVSAAVFEAAPTPEKKRTMSAAGRRRIAAAQRKRWAALKEAPAAKAAPKKRRISAAARKRMSEASKKRWVEFHAKKSQKS